MTDEKTTYNSPWTRPKYCCKNKPKDFTPVQWRDLSHPELEPGYLGDGVYPNFTGPSQLPGLLARYFSNKGEAWPKFKITQIPPADAWRVECEVDGHVCLAESYFRKSAREVCAAMVFKQLGVSKKELAGINVCKVEQVVDIELPGLTYLPDNSGRFPTNAAELVCFQKHFFFYTAHQVFPILNKLLIKKGYHAYTQNPRYYITQYVECTETRSGDCGWWTVTCVAGDESNKDTRSLSYKAEGEARMLTKQLSAAGMLVLLGLTRDDSWALMNSKARKRLREEAESEPCQALSVKPESSEAYVEPYRLAKAEPFPFIKAEPFPLAKADPFPVIKDELFPIPPGVNDAVKLEHPSQYY